MVRPTTPETGARAPGPIAGAESLSPEPAADAIQSGATAGAGRKRSARRPGTNGARVVADRSAAGDDTTAEAPGAGADATADGADAGAHGDDAGTDSRPPRRKALARELVLEIHALRTTLEETLQGFGARVHGDLAAAARRLEDGVMGVADAPLPPAKQLAGLLRDVRGLKLKPRKGRAKDLGRISRVAENLAEGTEDR